MTGVVAVFQGVGGATLHNKHYLADSRGCAGVFGVLGSLRAGCVAVSMY